MISRRTYLTSPKPNVFVMNVELGEDLYQFEISKASLADILVSGTALFVGSCSVGTGDLTGEKFGMLTALKEVERQPHGNGTCRAWLCVCECGTEVVRKSPHLKSIHNSSCGCILLKGNRHRQKLGASAPRPPEWGSWKGMRGRCLNPNHHSYVNYGGRGIKICDQWNLFANFLADVGPKPSPIHTLDRIDVNGHYEPSNCRWATPSQQVKNRRKYKPRSRKITATEIINDPAVSRA